MVHILTLLNGMGRTTSTRRGRNCKDDFGREAAESLEKEAGKNNLAWNSSRIIHAKRSSSSASVFSKRGKKGVNQDCCIVSEGFGCQEDMTFYGIFDGHGPWGHYVAKRIRKIMPSTLLCNWKEVLALTSADLNSPLNLDDIWKKAYLKTFAAVDRDLKSHPGFDSFYSGATASTIVRQGELMVIANVGNSRAVLATVTDDETLVPIQLTVDFKPNLPQEAERIAQSKGLVYCLEDEPGVYRLWLPNAKESGLAVSRAFGDYCMKDVGLISVPEVTQRHITSRDQFVILATDGVWDVISNEEAVRIVSSTPQREKSANKLVESAVCAWKSKKKGIAMDDISVICLFFHNCASVSSSTLLSSNRKLAMVRSF